MCTDHDKIRLVADLLDGPCHAFAGGFKVIIADSFFLSIPDGNIRCADTDHGNLDTAAVDDDPSSSGEIVSVFVGYICSKNRKFSLTQDLHHGRNAPVELMVADCHGVILHGVHGSHDRVRLIGVLL